MSKATEEAFLFDISEASKKISSYIAGMNYDDFLSDLKTQDSIIRNLEIKYLYKDIRHSGLGIKLIFLLFIRCRKCRLLKSAYLLVRQSKIFQESCERNMTKLLGKKWLA